MSVTFNWTFLYTLDTFYFHFNIFFFNNNKKSAGLTRNYSLRICNAALTCIMSQIQMLSVRYELIMKCTTSSKSAAGTVTQTIWAIM